MKTAIGKGFLVLSVILGVYLTCYAGYSAEYTQYIIDESEYGQIVAAREERDSLLEGLRLNEEILFYDHTSGTFYYSLVEGSSTAFNPSVKVISPYEDAQIAFLGGELTPEMIENNQSVTVLAYTKEYYGLYQLVCTTLPLINIDCGEEIGNEYISMEMTVFDNRQGTVNRVTASSGSIRVRGASSRDYPKLGYRLQLTAESLGLHNRTNQVSLLGMRQDDDWVLYAGYNDQEKVRNVFSSNLWKASCATDNALGIDAGMEYRYLELFINGEYWGLYALGYQVDKKQLEFGEDLEKEALYKTSFWVNEWNIFLTENHTVSRYEQRNVDEVSDEGWKLILEYYDHLYANRTDSEELYEWIDIDNAIDFYLFLTLIQGVDNVPRLPVHQSIYGQIYNFFLALKADSSGKITGLYIPWDLDRTWGNYASSYDVTPDTQVSLESGYLYQIILNRDTNIWEKIFDKYQSLRSGAWSNETVNSMLDAYEADIFDSGAYLRDMERWPEGTYGDPADKLNTFRQYVSGQMAEADLYYQRMEAVCQESIFIRRSALYKNFNQSRFLIEINNKSLLQDADYADLLEYLHVDLEKVTEDIRFIVAVPSRNSVEYFQTLGNPGDTLSTNAGVVSLEGDSESWNVLLDGVACYSGSASDTQDMTIVFMDDFNQAERLNLWKP